MKTEIIMLITAFTTIIGGILWQKAWKLEDYFIGTIGFILLAFSFYSVWNGFNL
jgi:hypothetical protein